MYNVTNFGFGKYNKKRHIASSAMSSWMLMNSASRSFIEPLNNVERFGPIGPVKETNIMVTNCTFLY